MYTDHTAPVLIVEDQPKNQKILHALCKQLGYHSDIAENGRVALDMIKSRTYSIYIVDLMMPVMDGREFIDRLKKTEPDAVILVQSALDNVDTIIDIMKLGVFDYIIKPIDVSLFKQTFNKAVEFKKLKEREIDQLRMFREEVATVREVQASLRPDCRDIENYDIAYAVLPAEELSGDFFDGFTVQNRQCLILCDVSGHGIASSYIGAEIKRIFRMSTLNGCSPSAILSNVNNTIYRDLGSARYLSTVALCQIDRENGGLVYASGGHPPSFLYRTGQDSCKRIKGDGPIIGFINNACYREIELPMNTGDCLLLYSDGITEAFSEDGSAMFMEERLEKAFMDSVHQSSAEIIYSILDAVYRFTNFSKQKDDITLISIKKGDEPG